MLCVVPGDLFCGDIDQKSDEDDDDSDDEPYENQDESDKMDEINKDESDCDETKQINNVELCCCIHKSTLTLTWPLTLIFKCY